jgi:hypothetical protein
MHAQMSCKKLEIVSELLDLDHVLLLPTGSLYFPLKTSLIVEDY